MDALKDIEVSFTLLSGGERVFHLLSRIRKSSLGQVVSITENLFIGGICADGV